ncbi:cytochrome P450 [Nonomuraea sp. NPDC059007]|uniref:cytochrome P450 n=1 Tax=Nonomuraea sp. NPDC059007 TaxID=3346692 RepID=UPI0036CA223E
MSELPEIPMPRGCPYHPPPGYDRLREHGPLARAALRDGTPVWVVTGHAQARSLLADPRLSSDALHPAHPHLAREKGAPAPDAERKKRALSFVEMDDPLHAEHRRMVIPHFSLRRVRELRPHLRSLADGLITAMAGAGPPADLVSALAAPLPALTLCAVLGVPQEDQAVFTEHLRWPTLLDPAAGPPFRVVYDLLARLLRDKAARPGDDVLSTLARRVAGGELSRRQAEEMAAMLVIAGHETTANTLALSVLTLLSRPGGLKALTAATMPRAVDELLRHTSVADPLPRVATAGISLGDRLIGDGDGVIVLLAAANRDAAAFPAPDDLDLDRRDARHLTFGHGPHQCLGNNLARAELETALSALLARLPTLRLAEPAGNLPVKPALSLQGVTRLPVTWGP